MSELAAISSLDWRGGGGSPDRDLVLRGASVLDPRAAIDGTYDVVVRSGRIAELAAPGGAEEGQAEIVDAEGKWVFPAFFDPHVHLRTPGDEDEEDRDLSRPAGPHDAHLGATMHEGIVSAALGVTGVPSVAESSIIARDASLAAYEDARIHVQHLSARESVEAVAAAKEAGVRITCEVTPHHLVLTDEEVRTLDARFKMNPPLRSEDDRQALIAGLRSGVIDCVATDHAPHSLDEKEVPFEEAAMGVTGLETAFSALHTNLVVTGALDLGVVVERMSAGATPFGFEPPTLAVGSEATLVLFDPQIEWEAGADGWESRSANSCFAGRPMRGRVLMTVVAGRVTFRQRQFALGVAPS